MPFLCEQSRRRIFAFRKLQKLIVKTFSLKNDKIAVYAIDNQKLPVSLV